MSHPSDTDIFERLEQQLAAVQTDVAPACSTHADVPADAVCSTCSRCFCWGCLSLDHDSLQFRCQACLSQALEPRKFRVVEVLRMPFFYVAVAVALAAIVTVLGIGNPSQDELVRADQGKPWYHRRVGKLWLRQALRVGQRLAMLERGKRTDEVRHWARLSQRALSEAHACWSDADIAVELQIGAALMGTKAGEPGTAYRTLVELGDRVPGEHPARQSYLFHRAMVAFEADDVLRAQSDVAAMLEHAERSQLSPGKAFDGVIDGLTAAFGQDRAAFLLRGMVTAVCDTRVPVSRMRESIRRQYEKRNLPLPVGLADEQGREPAHEVAQPPVLKAKTKLVIEHLEPQ